MATDSDAAIAALLQDTDSYQPEETAEAWSNEDVEAHPDALALLAETLTHMVDTD
jgi:hypothetical protein